MNHHPKISIIVPTYNEEKNIGRLLKSIKQQRYSPVETIIVDQSSTDQTPAIVHRYGATCLTLAKPKFYTPPGANRNKGAQKATGEILVHLDADMELPDELFITRLVGLFDHTHQAAIIHEEDVAVGFWNKCKALERKCYWGTSLETARAVTRRLFEQVGGYDEGISSGEDFLISAKYSKDTQIALDHTVFLYHHTGFLPLKRLLYKKYSYGKTAKTYLRSASKVDAHQATDVVGVSLQAYFANASYLLTDPVHYMGVFVIRLMEYGALILGMYHGNQK